MALSLGQGIISPNQEILAVASNDKTISLWEMKTWKFIGKLEGHKKSVTGICFTLDSKKLVSGGKDSTIRLLKKGADFDE